MPWFLCPMEIVSAPLSGGQARRCAMDRFTAAIRADGGAWSESEVLGNHALVKVRASQATLQAINAEPGFTRIPKDRLDDSLADLTQNQRLALRDLIEGLGYSREEWQARLGTDLGAVLVRDVLRVMATRRRKPRRVNGEIVVDGVEQGCRAVDSVDAEVVE